MAKVCDTRSLKRLRCFAVFLKNSGIQGANFTPISVLTSFYIHSFRSRYNFRLMFECFNGWMDGWLVVEWYKYHSWIFVHFVSSCLYGKSFLMLSQSSKIQKNTSTDIRLSAYLRLLIQRSTGEPVSSFHLY